MSALFKMLPGSISRRLMLFLSVTTLTVWLCSCVSIYFVIRHETSEIFDQSLLETAHVMISTHTKLVDGMDEDDLLPVWIPEVAEGTHSHRIIYQIWNRRGQNVFRSLGAPIQPLGPLGQSEQFGWSVISHTRYRTYQVWDYSHQYQLQIAEQWSVRELIFREIVQHLIIAILFFLPVLGLLIYWSVQLALSPIRNLAGQLAHRSGNNLSRLTLGQTPEEVRPLVDTLNHLFVKVETLIEQERRFTSNAAHELRTPLAAVKLYAQILQSATLPPELSGVATDIQEGADRCTRIVEQLLVLARLDPEQLVEQKKERVVLDRIVDSVIHQYGFMTGLRRIDVIFQSGNVVMEGSPEQLEILVRNLLDNAIRYSPPNSRIIIQTTAGQDYAALSVQDEGPGIPEALMQQVFERFYRIPGNQINGSGLGLSIVRQIVQVHGGQVRLENCKPSGLKVHVLFGPEAFKP